ncbi:AfsR/SARP family transcriptional regulator [Herbidospora mongoliensis]|uniref:AfsR/SARP family transcriptional regulator n=1 Tax=Herbidospora mongoliensis TaxID=688067 RepID=UPI000831FD5D|nr:BTAD domain-containing putative transcriptional regulator [Herbidospora mongoliensis]
MLTIRLLGRPVLERDGERLRPPRGRKTWALLGYLLLAECAPSRTHLARLLFDNAADPLGALRWTLTELRRAVGLPGMLNGDPLTLALGADVEVDVHTLTKGPTDTVSLLRLGGELLEGAEPVASTEFDHWLLLERHRLASIVEQRLRRTAATLLRDGHAREAVVYAGRAVARNPLAQANQELLIRGLATSGDHAAALRQIGLYERAHRLELGVDAPANLRVLVAPAAYGSVRTG